MIKVFIFKIIKFVGDENEIKEMENWLKVQESKEKNAQL